MIGFKSRLGRPVNDRENTFFELFFFLDKKRLTREGECGKINESPNGE